MMPITGPRMTEYPTSHVLTNEEVEDSSFHGWIANPKTAVRMAPARKEICLGAMFMKAFAGATMLAAMFVVRVAPVRPEGGQNVK